MTEPLYATESGAPHAAATIAAADTAGPPGRPPAGPVGPTLTLPPAAPLRPAAAPIGRGGFWRLLFSGPRAILLMPVRPGSVFPGAGSCILLILLVTAIGVAGERWLLSPDDPTFNWSSLRAAWFDLPILLLGGAWLAQPRGAAARAPHGAVTPPLHFAAVMLCASVWIVLLAYGLFIAQTLGWNPPVGGDDLATWIYLGVPVWSFFVAVRTIAAMNRHAPIGALRRIVVLLGLAATSAWYILDPIEPYWTVPPPPEGEVLVLRDGLAPLPRA